VRHRPVTAFLICLTLVGVVSCSMPEERSRVIILGIDGLDPLAVDLLVSEGKLPNLARLQEEGAWGHLISPEPRLSPILWTTIATGKPPAEHGIGHFTAVDRRTGEMLPVTSTLRRVKALWNIASDHDLTSTVVGWWATWPAEPINGAVVSDHTCYHFLFEQGAEPESSDEQITSPPELAERLEPLIVRPGDVTWTDTHPYIDVAREEFDRPFDFADDVGHFRWILATTETYRRIGLELWRDIEPELLMVYIEGVDSASHLFGHLFRTEGLAGELEAQQQRYGRAVEEMYVSADRVIGDYLAVMDEETTLLVMSDHGFTLGELHEDPGATRTLRKVSARFHRREGVLGIYGHRALPGAHIEDAQQVDIAPTVLSLLGLPIAEDMPGRVLTEAVAAPPEHPTVASFEDSFSETEGRASSTEVDGKILERLEALGYIEERFAASPSGELTAAGALFSEGRYSEAIPAFAKMVQENPDNARLRASLAGALGAVGRYDEAVEHLEIARELNPLLPEVYHNHATILERQGETERAVELYRTALKYSPEFGPSRQALVRLTGSPGVRLPADDRESEAMDLASRARQAAIRGDYESALALLDDAQARAPDLAMVYQYRSNVAYLMGDSEAALRAIERALELDPENELYLRNYRELTGQSYAPRIDGPG
jgi:predicted AlkP superfamily phosphohydrolase/phosphomutase/Flp pilus assembly protein TadD